MNIANLEFLFRQSFSGYRVVTHVQDGVFPAYIQAFPSEENTNIHFELIQQVKDGDVFLEFHVERGHYWEYEAEVDDLTNAFVRHNRDILHTSYYSSQIWRCRRPVKKQNDLLDDVGLMKEAVRKCFSQSRTADTKAYNSIEQVGIAQIAILDLIKRNLTIPSVQREYCWSADNVRRMIADLQDWGKNHDGLKYHFGSVVLKEKESCGADYSYEIFDGQQRLTTFALWLYAVQGESVPLLNEEALYSSRSRKCLLDVWNELRTKPRQDLLKWAGQYVDVSIVMITKDAPADLPFRFFNHVNSSGMRLTDYELMKSHHLRFVGGDLAQEAAKRWHDLELASDGNVSLTERLLHQTLYRLRMWSIGERGAFPFDAANTDERLLFRHFRATAATPLGIMAFPRPMEFDSLVTGGMAFFDFVSRQRSAFEAFSKEPAIKALDDCLSWHSRGVLWAGIRALCFLYYLRFGTAYLGRAVCRISRHVSIIRNQNRVMGSHLSRRPEFREVCDLLRRATDEGQFFAALETIRSSDEPDRNGTTKENYWNSLEHLQKELENV